MLRPFLGVPMLFTAFFKGFLSFVKALFRGSYPFLKAFFKGSYPFVNAYYGSNPGGFLDPYSGSRHDP